MGELLRGIRVVKMLCWEPVFVARVGAARAGELRQLAARKYLDALCVYFWAATQLLFAVMTFGLMAWLGQPLTWVAPPRAWRRPHGACGHAAHAALPQTQPGGACRARRSRHRGTPGPPRCAACAACGMALRMEGADA